jgi:DUF1680 family protein
MSKGRNKKAASLARELNADFREVLRTTQGRRVLWEVLGIGGFFRNSFDPHSGQMSFNCGRQSVAEELMELINEANPEAFLTMMRESRERENGKPEGTDAAGEAGGDDDGEAGE